MEEDKKKINKFLELFPDNLAGFVFNKLGQNMIRDKDLESMNEYRKYIKNYDLNFKDKKLKTNHLAFFENIGKMNSLIGETFFRLDPKSPWIVLHPDVKINKPELWRECAEKLSTRLAEVEDSHRVLRKSIEEYLLKGEGEEGKIKYPAINETIRLKTLGLSISENGILKGTIKKEINPTDRAIIHYLYCRFIEDAEQCISLAILAAKIKKEERNIENRKSEINKIVRELVLNGKKGWREENNFIKYEKKQGGYHLNLRLLIQFRKKK